jgi:hypothetical protein
MRLSERVRLPRYTRTAIQMGVAVGAAIAHGDLLSGRRFYWAVIAAFVTFMGANNSGEQVRKAFFRVAGTVVGVAAGSLLVPAIGHHTYWSIAVVLAALFFGLYLVRINYTLMARTKGEEVITGDGGQATPVGAVLTDRLDHLFRTVHPRGGGPFTPAEVAEAINTAAGEKVISSTYVWQLRTGRRDNPTLRHLSALATFFGVSPHVFLRP